MNEELILKKCPCCGGKALCCETLDFGAAVRYFVTCLDCGLETKRDYRTKYHAAEAWNKRAGNEDMLAFAKIKKERDVLEQEIKNSLKSMFRCDICKHGHPATKRCDVEEGCDGVQFFEWNGLAND